jgi:cellulose synthase/poly-beta-1,6-N-acetylglucosamine synthase-like glycosyltransferase
MLLTLDPGPGRTDTGLTRRVGGSAMSAYLDLSWLLLALAGFGLLVLIARVGRWLWSPRHRAVRAPALSLLVVVRNKESLIEGLVRGLLACCQRNAGTATSEVVVVDNRSTDETPAILERLTRSYPNLRAVRMADLRSGVDSAVEVGMFMCSGPVVLLLNAEGQVHARTLLEAAEYFLGAKPQARASELTGVSGAGRSTNRGSRAMQPFQGKERIHSSSN